MEWVVDTKEDIKCISGEQDAYRRADFLRWALPNGSYLVYRPGQGGTVISSSEYDLLDSCIQMKTLSEHAREALRGLASVERSNEVYGTLSTFARKGLLLSLRDLITASQGTVLEVAPELGQIAIPTCDRPDAVRRSLTGLLANVTAFGHSPRVTVVDSSHDEVSRQANRGLVRQLTNLKGLPFMPQVLV